MEHDVDVLEKYSQKINRRESFSYKAKVAKPIEQDVPKGFYAINCNNCHMTCFKLPKLGQKEVLIYVKCKTCPGQCSNKDHVYTERKQLVVQASTEDEKIENLFSRYRSTLRFKLTVT